MTAGGLNLDTERRKIQLLDDQPDRPNLVVFRNQAVKFARLQVPLMTIGTPKTRSLRKIRRLGSDPSLIPFRITTSGKWVGIHACTIT